MRHLAGLLLLFGTVWSGQQAGAELLYWRPTTGGFDYALTGILIGQSSIHSLSPDFGFGVRAFATLEGCIALRLSGLLFRSTETDVEFGPLFPAFRLTITPPSDQEVRAKVKHGYWHGELRCSYAFLPWISAHAAVRYVGLEERQLVRSNEGERRQLLQLYGGGPGFGMSTRLCIIDDLGFSTDVTAFALIAERKTDIAPIRYAHDIAILPALDLRLAFFYTVGRAEGSLGYAMDYIFDAVLQKFSFFESPQRMARDAGFAGPFAQASLQF